MNDFFLKKRNEYDIHNHLLSQLIVGITLSQQFELYTNIFICAKGKLESGNHRY